MLLRVYALYASDLHLPSLWISRSAMSSSPLAVSVVASLIGNECWANSSGFRPDFALIARGARPYLTTLTAFPHRYEERGTWSAKPGNTCHQLQHRGNGPAGCPKGRPWPSNLTWSPHAHTANLSLIPLLPIQPHLFLVRFMAPHDSQLCALSGKTPRHPASGSAKGAGCPAPESAVNTSSDRIISK